MESSNSKDSNSKYALSCLIPTHFVWGAFPHDNPLLGCDFFGSVTYTHIRLRRFPKFFPSHAKVSYAKVSYLRMLST